MKKLDVPICPFDGRPCSHDGHCFADVFDSDGISSVWRCPRLRKRLVRKGGKKKGS